MSEKQRQHTKYQRQYTRHETHSTGCSKISACSLSATTRQRTRTRENFGVRRRLHLSLRGQVARLKMRALCVHQQYTCNFLIFFDPILSRTRCTDSAGDLSHSWHGVMKRHQIICTDLIAGHPKNITPTTGTRSNSIELIK